MSRTHFYRLFPFVLAAALFPACKTIKYVEVASPEESGLNLVKVTDENSEAILGNKLTDNLPYINNTINDALTNSGTCKASGCKWGTNNVLRMSPDGTKIAYAASTNGQGNIMVRNINSQGIATQRTFRDTKYGFDWGADNRIYFVDEAVSSHIVSVDASKGSVMKQHTTGEVNDYDPVLSSDKGTLFFTRVQKKYGPSIWSLDMKNGTLSSCARGYNPCIIPGNNNSFYCVRNTTDGKSEIWLVDYVNGEESVIVSDINRSFTNPQLSPDGKWLLLVGNSKSNISKRNNLDVFVVRTDGSQLTQLTYHPEVDTCPIWSKDGKFIYFISSRGNNDSKFNIWKMVFAL